MVIHLPDILARFTEDHAPLAYSRSLKVSEVGSADAEGIGPISVYQMEAAAHFGPWIDMEDPPELESGG